MPSDDLSARMAKLSPAQRAVLERMVGAAAERHEVTAARTSTEATLLEIWREVLKNDRIGVTDSFYVLGGDSITSLQVSARASAAGIRVTSRQILEEETIERLAAVAHVPTEADSASDEPVGEVVLTPIQRWFFEQRLPHSHHWDQAIFVDVAAEVDEALLRAALAALVSHHDGLRSCFTEQDGQWRQLVAAEHRPPALAVADLAHLDEIAQREAVDAATAKAQEEIDLAEGPLLTAVLFRLGTGRPGRLLIAVHHLVVDGVSMRVLVEDLATAYRALLEGAEVVLPAKTTSFREWSRALTAYAHSARVRGQAEYWRSVPDAAAASSAFVDSDADVLNTVARSATATKEVAPETVRALRGKVFRSSGTSVLHVLLAAFNLAWRARTGRTAVQIELERHGREHIDDRTDVSRTVGWFTAIHPVVLSLSGTAGLDDVVESVRRQLDRVPDNGIGYGLLRYLTDGGDDDLAGLPQSEISFNYLGWFDRPGRSEVFGSPSQSPSQLVSPAAPRRYLLDVVITGIEDRLVVELVHATDACSALEASALLDEFVEQVEALVMRRAVTPDAFPLAGVAGNRLADVVRQVGITR